MEPIIDLLNLISHSGMLVLIWIVQVIIYPGFHAIESERFIQWHERYVQSFSFIVIPLMITQAATSALQLLQNTGALQIMEFLCLLIAWVVTFTLSVPCHKKLHELGKDTLVINHLIKTNWLRTIAWTLSLIISLLHS